MEARLATIRDAPLLVSLHAESFGDACWSREQFNDSLALPTTQAWVIEQNGAIQGFILCQTAGDEAEILTFCVTRNARGKGVGRLLLMAAIAEARKKNAHRMFLEVAVDNQPALRLYETSGFRVIGSRANYYQREGKSVDAVMYSLDLQAHRRD